MKDIHPPSDRKTKSQVSSHSISYFDSSPTDLKNQPTPVKPKDKNIPPRSDAPSSSGTNRNPPVEIVAYSQQSRFHRETFDASSSDIDIKGVNVSVNNREILVDAHLRLKESVRYGMVGQNGVGKSGEFKSSFRWVTLKTI